MSSVAARCLAGAVSLMLGASSLVLAQQPASLAAMVAAERAFAARALVVGWKQAFLQYFAPDAIGFSDAGPVQAAADIRKAPDPPPDLRLQWEPRWGDIAASGDLGWLTGPTTTTREGAAGARYGNYASVWRRAADGHYEVLIDVGITTPAAVPFAPGFTRVPAADRFPGPADPDRALATLQQADDALLEAARAPAQAGWAGRLADAVRLHRPGQMPVTGAGPSAAALSTEPPLEDGARLGAAVAASADLGYSWGRYARRPGAGAPAERRGYYLRVWTRAGASEGRDGAAAWKVALDVIQPAQ